MIRKRMCIFWNPILASNYGCRAARQDSAVLLIAKLRLQKHFHVATTSPDTNSRTKYNPNTHIMFFSFVPFDTEVGEKGSNLLENYL